MVSNSLVQAVQAFTGGSVSGGSADIFFEGDTEKQGTVCSGGEISI